MLFLSAASEGDVTQYIVNGFDAHSRYKYDWTKYKSIVVSLAERSPANLYYLTDSPNKGCAAAKAGLTVIIVHRPDNRKYRHDQLQSFINIDTFDQLDFVPFEEWR